MKRKIKSNMTLYITLLAICASTLAFVGTTKKRVYKGDKSELTVHDNGTFRQLRHECSYSFIAKGNWNMKGDTMKLAYTQVRWKYGRNKAVALERSKQLYKGSEDTLFYLMDFGKGFERYFKMVLEK